MLGGIFLGQICWVGGAHLYGPTFSTETLPVPAFLAQLGGAGLLYFSDRIGAGPSRILRNSAADQRSGLLVAWCLLAAIVLLLVYSTAHRQRDGNFSAGNGIADSPASEAAAIDPRAAGKTRPHMLAAILLLLLGIGLCHAGDWSHALFGAFVLGIVVPRVPNSFRHLTESSGTSRWCSSCRFSLPTSD